MQELGPLLINATGGLFRNPYAWTNRAHVIALESPAGVGFSYCAEYPNCVNTDSSTARDARAAMQHFFSDEKFPELAKNEFFITGESYAGVYVPTLAKEILDNAPEINLVGIAAGDPCTDTGFQAESMNMLWYAHKNGLVQDDDFEFLWNTCGGKTGNDAVTPLMARSKWIRKNDEWAAASELSSSRALSAECTLAWRKYQITTSKGISQGWDGSYINELDFFADAAALDWDLPGSLDYFQAAYMRRKDVQEALHVRDAPSAANEWPGPPNGWEYHKEYDACNSQPTINASMVDIYREIAPKLKRGAYVFNGDVDPYVSFAPDPTQRLVNDGWCHALARPRQVRQL